MQRYIYSWRRKAGFITLVIACLVAGAWVRGLMIEDSFHHYNESSEWFFGSTNGGLYVNWLHFDPESSSSLAKEPLKECPFWMSTARASYRFTGADELPIDWDWNWCGFKYFGYERDFTAIIPYWSVALPLTLLSACLILWKPRKRPSNA
jgi:hypothetical protein